MATARWDRPALKTPGYGGAPRERGLDAAGHSMPRRSCPAGLHPPAALATHHKGKDADLVAVVQDARPVGLWLVVHYHQLHPAHDAQDEIEIVVFSILVMSSSIPKL